MYFIPNSSPVCLYVFVCACSVFLPWPPWWNRVRDHAADGETGLEDSIVLNSKILLFPAAVDQWAEVDVTGRCDFVPKGPHSNSQFVLTLNFRTEYYKQNNEVCRL